MTIDQFIEKLGKLRYKKSGRRLNWSLGPWGVLRVRVASDSRAMYCPITAVAKAETGRRWDTNYPAAAYAIGLAEIDAGSIIVAADCPRADALRAWLLKACGLTEAASS